MCVTGVTSSSDASYSITIKVKVTFLYSLFVAYLMSDLLLSNFLLIRLNMCEYSTAEESSLLVLYFLKN